MKRWVQNGPVTKNGVLPVIALFFWKFCFSLTTSLKSRYDVPTTQMSVFILFVSAGVLLEDAFSLSVSLKHSGECNMANDFETI